MKILCLWLAAALVLHGGAVTLEVSKLKLVNVEGTPLAEGGRKGLRLVDAAKDADAERLAIMPVKDFGDGVIEIELSGEAGPKASETARGFVGIAFRVQSEKQYEAFYLRPTNGRADDQVRRNHSTQYVSHPEFPWFRLRKEFPEKYESYVDLAPGEWTKVRIEVKGTTAKLFVHGAPQPALIVNDLKHGASTGGIALWVGPGTIAKFANLHVR
jgi:hypothetical protein